MAQLVSIFIFIGFLLINLGLSVLISTILKYEKMENPPSILLITGILFVIEFLLLATPENSEEEEEEKEEEK